VTLSVPHLTVRKDRTSDGEHASDRGPRTAGAAPARSAICFHPLYRPIRDFVLFMERRTNGLDGRMPVPARFLLPVAIFLRGALPDIALAENSSLRGCGCGI
jgi:hypothetical protein